MDLSVKVLDILFRRANVEGFIHQLMASYRRTAKRDKHCDSFMALAETTLSGYSYDEQENVYKYSCQIGERYGQKNSVPPFYLLTDYGNTVLSIKNHRPVCKTEEVLNWRDGYLRLGQDTIITAWLAGRSPLQPGINSYAWPAIISTGDPHMADTLDKLTENHLHLYAGASTFSLTWCCVMNDPVNMVKNHNWFSNGYLQMQHSRAASDGVWSLERKLIYAAHIRIALFKLIKGLSSVSPQVQFAQFHRSYAGELVNARFLEQEIERLKLCCGLAFSQPTGAAKCLDYAFCDELLSDIDKDFRLLAAERYFLYRCFQKCFNNEFDTPTQYMFYCYLLIKAQFRGEFIQLNQQTGFHNFHNYDSRKYALWSTKAEYWHEDYRQALNASFREQKILSVEGRLSPKDSALGNLGNLLVVDRAKLYYDQSSTVERRKISIWRLSYGMENKAKEEPYNFIMHFAKERDTFSKIPNSLCRHENFRKTNRKKAIELAKALSNSTYFCERVCGIDACSNEIGCRPEVFANEFRFLRNFPVSHYKTLQFSGGNPCLRATYHAGEDFLDISDGLRAIDEAILFLELERGDRLGHAMALGIDPTLHYKHKSYEIVLPKQDLLDDLVWCIYRSVEMNVQMADNLKSSLKSTAQSLYDSIYGKHCSAPVTLENYYHSMLLRGDAPECYKTGQFIKCPGMTDPFDAYRLCKSSRAGICLDDFRNLDCAVQLYHLYHYCHAAKIAGQEIITFKIDAQYIALMEKLQYAMQKYVGDCGISIECNPSSNVLIGTFGDYKNHPILSFNHSGLNASGEDVQLHVSINTDDPGVFDTSLTFEFELLAAALASVTDEYGNRVHSDQRINEYLQKVIRMGQEQRFNKTIMP